MDFLEAIENIDTSKIDLGEIEEVKKTIYIRPKEWAESYDPENPSKLIGIYSHTFFKEYQGKQRANHVILGPKAQEFVLNGCGDLDSKMSKVPPGACVCVSFAGMKENPMNKALPSYSFSVSRIRSLDLNPSQTQDMLKEIASKQQKFESKEAPKTPLLTSSIRKDLPF